MAKNGSIVYHEFLHPKISLTIACWWNSVLLLQIAGNYSSAVIRMVMVSAAVKLWDM